MREIERRLANLERHGDDATVRQISDLIDELSAKAAGTTVESQQSDLVRIFEGADHATP